MIILLKILGSKYTWIGLFVLTVIISSFATYVMNINYTNKYEVLEDTIEDLQSENLHIQKQYNFEKEQRKLWTEHYSNSLRIIDSLDDNDQDINIFEVITSYNEDYYKTFNGGIK